jgi:hypothetical protein
MKALKVISASLLSASMVITGSSAIALNKDLDLFTNPEINAPTQEQRNYWKGSSFYLVDKNLQNCSSKAARWLFLQLGNRTPYRNGKTHFYIGGRKNSRSCYAVTWR